MKPKSLSKICVGCKILLKVFCIGLLTFVFREVKNSEIKHQKWKDVRSTSKNPKK